MDAHALNTVSKTANLAEQKALPANAGQTDNAAKFKRDRRKATKTAKAALHNAQQGHDDSKLSRRKTRYAKSQFPFLRLPAEIRNRVYKIALQSSKDVAIDRFKAPLLLQVSQQIRREAAGLFTAVNNIQLNIRTTYVPFAEDKTPFFQQLAFDNIGHLQLDEDRREWLSGDKVVFRDISIGVFGAHAGMNYVGFFDIGGPINKYKYVVSSQIVNRTNLQYVQKMFSEIKADITKVMNEAQARPGFTGLNLGDLEKIAKFFDYVKPE